MDMQEYFNNALKASRKETFDKSDQLTLGEIILKLEPIVNCQYEVIKKYDNEATVVYDFEYLFPTDIDSWRGSYAELALNYVVPGHEEITEMTVTDFYRILKKTVGKTFTGYKGGEYKMSKNTPVWVANYGHSGKTAVIDIVDNEYSVIIVTGLREF